LVGGALEGSLERGDEAGVLVGDHQPHPAQAAALQRGQEAAPEHLVFGVTHVQPEHLAAAVGGDPGGHHDRHGHDLGGGVAHVQVGRVQVDVGEGGMVQPAGPERLDDLVQAGTDPGDLGLGDARIDAQRGDQVVDRPGRHPLDIGLHHHRVQGLIDPAPRLQDAGEERPLPQLRDRQLHITGLRGQQPRPRPIALGRARLGALIPGGADPFGGLGLDQLLHYQTHRLTDQIKPVTGAERLQHLGHGRLG